VGECVITEIKGRRVGRKDGGRGKREPAAHNRGAARSGRSTQHATHSLVVVIQGKRPCNQRRLVLTREIWDRGVGDQLKGGPRLSTSGKGGKRKWTIASRRASHKKGNRGTTILRARPVTFTAWRGYEKGTSGE